MRIYQHVFFASIQDAQRYRKSENKGYGMIYDYNNICQRQWYLEHLNKLDIRNKELFIQKKPVCLAWLAVF